MASNSIAGRMLKQSQGGSLWTMIHWRCCTCHFKEATAKYKFVLLSRPDKPRTLGLFPAMPPGSPTLRRAAGENLPVDSPSRVLALGVSGEHRRDWDPHRVHVEPILQKAKPGDTVKAAVVASNPSPRKEPGVVMLDGRGLTPDQELKLDVAASDSGRCDITLKLKKTIPPGRHVFPISVVLGTKVDGSDTFLVVDVE